MGCAGVQMDGCLDSELHTPTHGLELVEGLLSHAAAAAENNDHIVAVVDVRRASTAATWTPGPNAAGDCGTACSGRTGCKVVAT